MHDQRAGRGGGRARVDLVAGQRRETLRGFPFLAHGDPDVGVEHLGAGGGGLEIRGDADVAARPAEQVRRRAELAAGAAMGSWKPSFGGREDPGAGDVACAVADEADFAAGVIAEFFLEVEMSARIWQGCSSSVRALMVGMPEK